MKKLLTLVIILIVTLVLSGCTENELNQEIADQQAIIDEQAQDLLALESRVLALEAREDSDTVYDDTVIRNLIQMLEDDTYPKDEIDEGFEDILLWISEHEDPYEFADIQDMILAIAFLEADIYVLHSRYAQLIDLLNELTVE